MQSSLLLAPPVRPILLAAVGALAYLVAWALAMLRCRFFTRLGEMVARQPDGQTGRSLEPVSIVLTHNGKADELKKQLPLFLNQNHPRFEIILAALEPMDADTKKWLDTLCYSHPALSQLSLPSNMRNISRETFALTLAARSARYDWLMLSDISVTPASPQWLSLMAEKATPGTMFVCGFTWIGPGGGSTGKKARFLNLWRQMVAFPLTAEHGMYSVPRTNVMVHRPSFMAKGGLGVAPALREGVIPIAVNQQSHGGNTHLCLNAQAAILVEAPKSEQEWMDRQLFRQEATQYFTRGTVYRLTNSSVMAVTWVQTLLWFATLALAIWDMVLTPSFLPIPLCIVVTGLWVWHAWWRVKCFRQTTDALSIPPYRLSLAWYLHSLLIWNFSIRLHYDISDKNRYRKKAI